MEQSKKKNYGYYRVGALRSIGGGRKVGPNVPDKLKPVRTADGFSYQLKIFHITYTIGNNLKRNLSSILTYLLLF